jgi:acetyltransferase-like isoleucine patch superfamily enzyme
MAIGAEEHYEATLGPAEASDAPLEPRRSARARLAHYGGLLWRGMHLRFKLANFFCALLPDVASGAIRSRLYRLAGLDVDKAAFLMANLRLGSAAPGFYRKLKIGPGVTIADNVTINLDAEVTIGKNVAIAPHVLIYTGSHKIGPGSMRIGDFQGLPVTIGDGAWIRLGAIIVPGVTIGEGAVVAAGAIVLKDVPPHTYVEGNPAQVIRKLPWAYR